MVFRPGVRQVEYRAQERSFEPPGRRGADDDRARALPADEAAVAGLPGEEPDWPRPASYVVDRPAGPPPVSPGVGGGSPDPGVAPPRPRRPPPRRPPRPAMADEVREEPAAPAAPWQAQPEPLFVPPPPRPQAAGATAPPGPPPPPPLSPPPPLVPGTIIPGPPGGVLDLVALAEVEERLREVARASIDDAAHGGALGRDAAERRWSVTTAASSVAAALWFDTLRTEDRVSVTPNAGPLLAAVHEVLEDARPADLAELTGPVVLPRGGGLPTTALVPASRGATAGGLAVPGGRSARALRATGAGTAGPSGTVWGALARRFAGSRFEHGPSGRLICVLEYPELRDPAVWEAVTDERVAYLGELFWIVLVSGAAVGAEAEDAPRAGLGGPSGPDRAARMFEAAGWQVMTLRFGRRLHALFQRPGGQALRSRLGRMSQDEYRALLLIHGPELRRRLAGPGAAGAGIMGLLDQLSDEEIHRALRDLGGHDLALLIDAFDEVAADRPTVLFVHTHDAATATASPYRPSPVDRPGLGYTPSAGGVPRPGAVAQAALPAAGGGQPGTVTGARGARLATHVASYLDRVPRAAPLPPPLPADLDLGTGVLSEPGAAGPGADGGPGVSSAQDAFGALLRGLAGAAPDVVDALVIVSTRDADAVVAGWLDPGAQGGADAALATPSAARRHVAGAFSPGAFTGVLGNLAVAWNRQGVPLLPVGVTDELAAGRVVPAWAASCAADARSVLAIADTGARSPLASAAGAGPALAGVTRHEPAFAQDVAWILLDALDRLGRADGSSTLLRLSARGVDQRAAAVPAGGQARERRRTGVLAGGYRLRDGGPAPVVTLVGMGAVLPEVLTAADELERHLGAGVGVAVVTSVDLVFAALRARDEAVRAALDGARRWEDGTGGDVWVLEEILPAARRSPLVTVVDGDPRELGFLAGLHGDRLVALGPETPGGGTPPVPAAAVVEAALGLVV